MKPKLISIELGVREIGRMEECRLLTIKTGWLLIALCILADLTGCVTMPNGFSQFYQDRAGAGITNFLPYSGTTKIFSTGNLPNDARDVYRNGYGLIGESAFQGPPQADGALMPEAKTVGADLVLLSCKYLGSQDVAVPWIQYSPGQTYTTTSSGTVGNANFSGTSTTTSPGTFSTQVVPITIQRYEYDAAFYRKFVPPIFGALPQALPAEIRQQLERNTGVIVWVVRNGSPAYNANILEGDVILKMNGEDVLSVADYVQRYIKLAGQKVELEIWRNGQVKNISVQFNNKP